MTKTINTTIESANTNNNNVKQTEIKIYEKQPKKNFTSKDDLLMESLTEFFSNTNHLYQMLPIILKKANISLRILDWFVTNYAKEEPVIYKLDDKLFNVYNSYKDQLTAYSKKRFDPFRRRCQKEDGQQVDVGIKFWYTNDKYIATTVGQLNFFKWAIEKNVLGYIVNNLQVLVDKMLISSKQQKTAKKKSKKSKNNENNNTAQTTSVSPPQSMVPSIPQTVKGSPNLSVKSDKVKPIVDTETFTNLTVDTNNKTGDVSISATKLITKKENVKIVLSFN